MPRKRTKLNPGYMLRVLEKDQLLWDEFSTVVAGDFGVTDVNPEDFTSDYESWSKPCKLYCLNCNAVLAGIPKEIIRANRCTVCGASLCRADNVRFLDEHGERLYRLRITRLTQVAAKHFRELIRGSENLWKNGVAGPGFVRDHAYSVREGFENDVAEEIISSPVNLQILSTEENFRKGRACDFTLEELRERYQRFLDDNPGWLELVRISDERGPGTLKVRIG